MNVAVFGVDLSGLSESVCLFWLYCREDSVRAAADRDSSQGRWYDTGRRSSQLAAAGVPERHAASESVSSAAPHHPHRAHSTRLTQRQLVHTASCTVSTAALSSVVQRRYRAVATPPRM